MPEQVRRVARGALHDLRIFGVAFILVLAIVALLSSCASAFKAEPGRFTATSKQWAVDIKTTPAGSLRAVYIEAPAGSSLATNWKAIAGTSSDNHPWVLLYPETRY